MTARFKTPIIIGNDGNFGALGETWLGSARNAKSALYICVGTGIGAGLVQRGKLWRGDRESAGEIGHMIMQLGGPKCGCGGHGCFEALASRTAIERDLREAISGGRKSVLLELAGGDLSVIRSGMIRKALDVEDELVCKVMRRAAEVLGYACVNVRHLIDPEAIVFGGGVIEACSDFIMPIIENIVGHRSAARRARGRPRAAFGLGRRRRGARRRGRRAKIGRPQPLQEAIPRQADLPGNHPHRRRRNRRRRRHLRTRHLHLGRPAR